MASEAGHEPGRAYFGRDGALYLNGAPTYNSDGNNIKAQLDVLDTTVAAELSFIDGAVAGTLTASKTIVVDSSSQINRLDVTGDVRLAGRVYTSQAAPETITDTASLTDAQILSGILVATPSAVATYTMRTGTQIEAALSASNMTNGDSFDLTIINLGGAGDIITMAVATGVTFVGSVTIDDAGADINSSGTFRIRRTAANTFVCYRIS